MKGSMIETRFADRREAGELLARELGEYANRSDVVVLALLRGGVPVGYEVAHAIGTPLDILLVRKIGVPSQPELAMGAVAAGGLRVLNYDVIAHLDINEADVEDASALARQELEQREAAYRGERVQPDLRARIVILVDDGLATGATMRVAIQSVRLQGAARVVVAVPVAAMETARALEREVDEFHCLFTPEQFDAIGHWYDDFSQVADREVQELLKLSEEERGVHRRDVREG
jgi:putative phosphoribosyl transferase